jgi:hypothetical protein
LTAKANNTNLPKKLTVTFRKDWYRNNVSD